MKCIYIQPAPHTIDHETFAFARATLRKNMAEAPPICAADIKSLDLGLLRTTRETDLLGSVHSCY